MINIHAVEEGRVVLDGQKRLNERMLWTHKLMHGGNGTRIQQASVSNEKFIPEIRSTRSHVKCPVLSR